MIGLVPSNGNGAAPINQDNIPKYVFAGLLNENTIAEYNAKLNAIDLTVLETDSPVYFLFSKKAPTGTLLIFETWTWKFGKGVYEPVGAVSPIESMYLLETNYPQLGDLLPIFESGTLIDLGEINTDLITYINNQVEFDLSNETTYYIQFTLNGVTQVYQYTGLPLIYGTSTVNTAVITDFDLIYSSINFGSFSPQNLQQTVDNGEIADKVKFVNRFEFNVGASVNGYIRKIINLDNEKILIAGGFTAYNGIAVSNIVVLNQDGTISPSFTSLGFSVGSEVYNVVRDADGKFLITGLFSTYNGVANSNIVRLNSDGTIDESFDVGTGFNQQTYSVSIDENNKIIITGDFTTYKGVAQNRIIRLNADGSKDETFDVGSGFNAPVLKATILNNGKIAVGGNFTQIDGLDYPTFVILNTDGTVDEDFFLGFVPFIDGTIYDIIQTSDDNLVLGGEFNYQDSFINILKVDLAGTTTFPITVGFNNRVETIIEQTGNKLLIGGLFTDDLAENEVSYLQRINFDGTIDETFVGTPNQLVIALAQFKEYLLVSGNFTLFNEITINKLALTDQNGELIEEILEEKLTFSKDGNGIAEYFTNKTFDELGENELVPKGLIPISSSLKQAIYYIGSQDETGFIDVEERVNNIGLAFDFVLAYPGGFECANFNPLIHRIDFDIRDINQYGVYRGRGDQLKIETYTYISGVVTASEYAFQYGGFITITEIPALP